MGYYIIIVGKHLVVIVVVFKHIVDDRQHPCGLLCDLLLGHLCLHVNHLFMDQHRLFGYISLASYLVLEDHLTSYNLVINFEVGMS